MLALLDYLQLDTAALAGYSLGAVAEPSYNETVRMTYDCGWWRP